MAKHLRRLFLILIAICIPAGFFAEHDHAVFWWHHVPSLDAVFGFLGAFLFIGVIKIVGAFASREEGFYD